MIRSLGAGYKRNSKISVDLTQAIACNPNQTIYLKTAYGISVTRPNTDRSRGEGEKVPLPDSVVTIRTVTERAQTLYRHGIEDQEGSATARTLRW